MVAVEVMMKKRKMSQRPGHSHYTFCVARDHLLHKDREDEVGDP